MKKGFLFLLLMLVAGSARAQSISPVIQQCSTKPNKGCAVNFHATNTSLRPMWVVLEPHSMSLTPEKKPVLRPLDSGVVVALSQQSAKLYPLENHEFEARISCPTVRCAVQISVIFALGRSADNSMNLRLSLPESIYSCSDRVPHGDCRGAMFADAERVKTGFTKE